MLGWALTFLVVALIAAVLGFGGVAGVAMEAAKIIFFVAIALFLVSAIIGLVRRRSPGLQRSAPRARGPGGGAGGKKKKPRG